VGKLEKANAGGIGRYLKLGPDGVDESRCWPLSPSRRTRHALYQGPNQFYAAALSGIDICRKRGTDPWAFACALITAAHNPRPGNGLNRGCERLQTSRQTKNEQ
jgi:hypothetical protein